MSGPKNDTPDYLLPSNNEAGRATLLGGGFLDEVRPDLDAGATQRRGAVVRTLPGVGETYLDPEFASKLDAFVQHARDRGVNIQFESAYRTPAYQEYLPQHQAEKNVAFPPAKKSFHSAGLAVDIRHDLASDTAERRIILDAADKAGLRWGGTFNDPTHFDYNIGGNLDTLIGGFGDHVRNLQLRRLKGPL